MMTILWNYYNIIIVIIIIIKHSFANLGQSTSQQLNFSQSSSSSHVKSPHIAQFMKVINICIYLCILIGTSIKLVIGEIVKYTASIKRQALKKACFSQSSGLRIKIMSSILLISAKIIKFLT